MLFKPKYPTPQGVTNSDLLALLADMRHELMRVETRLCKLMEHVGAAHLLNKPSKDTK